VRAIFHSHPNSAELFPHPNVPRNSAAPKSEAPSAADILLVPTIGRPIDRSGPATMRCYLWAVVGVLVATGLYLPIDDFMAKGHDPSLLFLPVVIACAVRLGFGPAILASILCFLSWDYLFVQPRLTLLVAHPQDYLALGIFLLTGITAAQLAGQVRREAEESRARGEEIATLFRIGQIVGSEFDPERVMATLAAQIAQACATRLCIVYRTGVGGELNPVAMTDADYAEPDVQERLLHLAQTALSEDQIIGLGAETFGADETLTILPGAFIPLHIHDARVGVLCVGQRLDERRRSSRERNLLLALANYTAAVIARQNLADEAQQRMQAAAVTEERNRLTREIHDTVAQGLTGIVIQLQAADGAPPNEQAIAIELARALAQESLAEARRSVRAMRPGALEASDLAGALRKMADRSGRRTSDRANEHPHTTFRTEGSPRALPSEMESELLRIGQEALTNALRHSGAATIAIRLRYETNAVCLMIEDDGCGIDSARAASTTTPGFGMTSMDERAAKIGAVLEIASDRPDRQGTMVSVTAPLPTESHRSRDTCGVTLSTVIPSNPAGDKKNNANSNG
jgi:signal transduction histidine kinase